MEWVGDGKWAYDTAGMKLKSPADRPARVPGNQISGRPYYVRVHRGEVRWTKPLVSTRSYGALVRLRLIAKAEPKAPPR